jgi:AraC-like DNA-binding protein
LSTHHLSQLLNQQLHITFYDYINQYRLEEVKQALWDPQEDHLTILALAFEAWFKSKSVFNEAFKKYTGITPSAYKKARQ